MDLDLEIMLWSSLSIAVFNALQGKALLISTKRWFQRRIKKSADIVKTKIANMFEDFHMGKKLPEEISKPFSKSEYHKSALSFNIYSLKKWELLKACTAKEWLLMKCNSFVHVFKTAQLVITAVVTMTVFLRTQMNIDVVGANFYMGSLIYAIIRLMCNGIAELSLTGSSLGIFYKQRDFYFYPAWTYSIPTAILKIPLHC